MLSLPSLSVRTLCVALCLKTVVWATQRDHADAINNLMDLLESTATRADLAALADDAARETEGQLQAASDGLTAAIQKQAADFDELYAQVADSTHAAEAAAAVDEQLREMRVELSTVRQSASQLAQDGAAKLSVDFRGLERTCERRIGDVERRCSQALQSAEVWGERVQTQSIVADQVAASVQALEAKMESATELLHKETDQ